MGFAARCGRPGIYRRRTGNLRFPPVQNRHQRLCREDGINRFPIRRSIRRLDATRRSVCAPHAANRHLQPSARNVPLGCQLQVGRLLDNLDFCACIQRSRVEQLLQRSLVVSMGLRRRKLRHSDLHGQLFHRHTLSALSHRYVRVAPKFLHLERHLNGRPGHDHRQSRCQ